VDRFARASATPGAVRKSLLDDLEVATHLATCGTFTGKNRAGQAGHHKDMAWLLLIVAGLLEIVWAIALKHTEGFTRLWPSVVGITSAVGSFVMLAAALQSLPVGTAYAVWVGIGAIGVSAVGIVLFGENASLLRLGCLALVTAGIIGLKLVDV
jgi:quaternary ammonium compound-resistance protein SugE